MRPLANHSIMDGAGKTYRLRIVNISGIWAFRFFIEGHSFNIISISGGDVSPVKVCFAP